jgi:hypothetical protein
MGIWVTCSIRWPACAALLASIAMPMGAQTPAIDALPTVPDATYPLIDAASSAAPGSGVAARSANSAAMRAISSAAGPGFAAESGETRPSSAQHEPGDANESAPRQGFADPAIEKDSASRPAAKVLRHSKRADFNRDIYYRNKLEFSLETGWLPINIPFVFDFLVGSAYTTWPLHYTMVPNIASIRWHVDGIGGPSILRGNTDFTFSGSYTAIPRGAETRYFAFDYGIRQNFVQPRWRIVPYFEARGGAGNINAKGPYGVPYAQGQDLTFTLMMGSGARYNFNPRYSIAAGMTYMHVSNAYLSQPRYEDLGINVYGPIVGINVRIGRPKQRSGR